MVRIHVPDLGGRHTEASVIEHFDTRQEVPMLDVNRRIHNVHIEPRAWYFLDAVGARDEKLQNSPGFSHSPGRRQAELMMLTRLI